jgi:lipopolysaccharide export system permease protein
VLGSLAYFNTINLTQTWVASGRLRMVAAFVMLHGGVFVLALVLLWWRDHSAVLHFRRAQSRRIVA